MRYLVDYHESLYQLLDVEAPDGLSAEQLTEWLSEHPEAWERQAEDADVVDSDLVPSSRISRYRIVYGSDGRLHAEQHEEAYPGADQGSGWSDVGFLKVMCESNPDPRSEAMLVNRLVCEYGADPELVEVVGRAEH